MAARLTLLTAGVVWHQFCAQLAIMPDKVSRPDLMNMFRRATQEFADDGVEEALSYPEFVELLTAIAEFAFR
jgi:hypothetical protein